MSDAKQMIRDGALVVDVRTQSEWDQGHLAQAKLLPLPELAQRLRDVEEWAGGDKAKPIVVYCRSGRRSGEAKTILERAGFARVENGGGYDDLK